MLSKEWESYANLHRFDIGNEYLAGGLIWASIASALMKRFISSSAQMITGKMLSTRKVTTLCSFYFTRMMIGIMNGKLDEAEDNARLLVKFLGDNARRSHSKRDRKSGRGKLRLKATGGAECSTYVQTLYSIDSLTMILLDSDARWTKKNNQSHLGYKNPIRVSNKHKLIRNEFSRAHDLKKFFDVLSENTSKNFLSIVLTVAKNLT